MNAAELKQIAEWLEAAGLSSIEIKSPDGCIRLVVPPDENAPAQNAITLAASATAVGVLLDCHPLRTTPLVQVGSSVTPGAVIALVRNGPVMTPVIAPCIGHVTGFLVTPGMMVDYGRAVIEIVAEPRAEG